MGPAQRHGLKGDEINQECACVVPHGPCQDDGLASEAVVIRQIICCLDHSICAVSDDDVVIWDSAAQVRYLPPILARDLGAVLKWFSLAVSVLGNRVRRVNSDA